MEFCIITVGTLCVTIHPLFWWTLFTSLFLICFAILEIAKTFRNTDPKQPADMNPVFLFNDGLVRITVHWREAEEETLDIANDSGEMIRLAIKDQDFGDTSLADYYHLEAGTHLTVGMNEMPDRFKIVLKINGGEESKIISRPE